MNLHLNKMAIVAFAKKLIYYKSLNVLRKTLEKDAYTHDKNAKINRTKIVFW